MQDLAELERRIAAALQRIGDGVEALSMRPAAAPATEDGTDSETETRIAALEADLAAERALSASLRQRISELEDAPPTIADLPTDVAALYARIDKMTAQLDVQGLEMQRMRKTVVQLRENLRGLRRAQVANLADPEQINRAMMAEIEAMRVSRLSEVAEMDEILSELTPLITEERADA
ncbi:hypothetical protein C0V75_08025 [Tabrizicola sp. TH137]|uniref:hypothetical protein n=1 Tax=Tabrizicola sp. TH137 TaxID=2067452 RepID=UPI000C7A9E97|nr:hypothetical protein [Tabrizicola sp. TH137]PLL13330.1 hypothetical protein C0V75_08025 [Tabrizicola sp. TH137]